MPALPGKLINKALRVGVKRASVGIGTGRLWDISSGTDLVASRVDMLMAARGSMLRTAVLRSGVMVQRSVRSVGLDGMRVETTVGVMRGRRGDPCGCGVAGDEVPSKQLAALAVIDFAIGLAPSRDDICIMLTDVALHALVDTDAPQLKQRTKQ